MVRRFTLPLPSPPGRISSVAATARSSVHDAAGRKLQQRQDGEGVLNHRAVPLTCMACLLVRSADDSESAYDASSSVASCHQKPDTSRRQVRQADVKADEQTSLSFFSSAPRVSQSDEQTPTLSATTASSSAADVVVAVALVSPTHRIGRDCPRPRLRLLRRRPTIAAGSEPPLRVIRAGPLPARPLFAAVVARPRLARAPPRPAEVSPLSLSGVPPFVLLGPTKQKEGR